MRRRAHAAFVVLALLTAPVTARADDERRADHAALLERPAADTTPVFFRDLELRAPALAMAPSHALARPLSAGQPLELGLHDYVRLAVHGDGQPGFSTFVGTSTVSLGGFRLRF